MPIELNPLERRVMEMLLAGNDPTLDILRQQLRVTEVVERKLTGVGFFVTFAVPAGFTRLEGRTSSHLGDVEVDIDGLQHGAGFILFVREGAIDCLEGYSYGEPWPANTDRFLAKYFDGDERNLAVLWK